jgi:cobalt-zinc-cadmium efflux system outer membrane protein
VYRRLLAALCLALPTSALAQAPALRLSELPSDADLARLVWQSSPELAAARARAAAAAADFERAKALPNPNLDLSWNTIPLGPTNPPDQPHPLATIPNYAAVISEQLELGKRGPRQQSTRKAAEAALLDGAELLRQKHLDLIQAVGQVANSEERIAALEDLVADAAALTELQQKRAQKGDTAELDTDRARLDEEKLRSSLAEERQKLALDLIACAQLVGRPCEPFGDAAKARQFLIARAEPPAEQLEALRGRLDERPDLRSLDAQQQSARAAEDLARAKAIPDPGVRVGYVFDNFLVSGNQGQSLSVGVSVPLPLFERGQADAAQARAAALAASQSLASLRAQSERDLGGLLEQARQLKERRTRMDGTALPLARGVVERLTRAVQSGGSPLQDLLAARRTLGELLEDSADLDLAAFEIAVSISRTVGALPLPEQELGQGAKS